MYKEQKIKLLKGTNLVSFLDKSTLNYLVDHCPEIFLEIGKILFNEDYLEIAMHLSNFWINCNKTHYRTRLNDICFAI